MALEKKFKINNLDYNLFLEEIEIQTRWQNFIYIFYKGKIEINENSVNDELKKLLKMKRVFKSITFQKLK